MTMSREPVSATGGERSTRERWLAAVCYLGPLVFWPMLGERHRSAWLAQHVREGFALFAAEVAAWLALILVDTTLGRIPVLGFLVSLLLHLAVGLTALVLSITGFFRALAGETWHVPGLEELASRIPVEATENESKP